jgi:RNA polymerase sigma factor (sigma-70 family)
MLPSLQEHRPLRPANYEAHDDVLLVIFARKLLDRDAVRELLSRYHAWLSRLINRYARLFGLPRQDWEDACHEALLALPAAIADYDLLEACKPNGCSFRTFFGRRALSRFQDELKRHCWRRAHLREQEALAAALQGADRTSRAAPGEPPALCGRGDDPVQAAQQHELAERVRQVLAGFPEEQRPLLEQALAGTPLRQLARQFHISRATAVRRKHQLMDRLRQSLS